MEPWEALDVDDSELSSFIRPPKRQFLDPGPTPPPQPSRNLTLEPSASGSILRPCSQLGQPQTLTTSQATPNSQNLAPGSLRHLEASPPLPRQPGNSARQIPGPAGEVQVAMQRKVRNSELLVQGDGGEAPFPTQEYIRRAMEEVGKEDGDFALNPWVCAVEFIRREGLVSDDGLAIGTPLCAIKNGHLTDKVPQVMAIIKSCKPNGLGDLTVMLKDPTGSIGASIHRRVLNHENFGKEISVGAVLILQKVAVFSPVRSACYLNITLNNVVKVISKDAGPLSDRTIHAPTVKHTSVEGKDIGPLSNQTTPAPTGKFSTKENGEKPCQSETAVPQSRKKIDGIMSGFRQTANTRANRHSEQPDVGGGIDSHREHDSSTEKQPVSMRNDAASQFGVAEVDVLMVECNTQVSVGGDGTKQGNDGEGSYSTDNHTKVYSEISDKRGVLAEDADDGRVERTPAQKEPVGSRSSLPEWTDEQLELLEYD